MIPSQISHHPKHKCCRQTHDRQIGCIRTKSKLLFTDHDLQICKPIGKSYDIKIHCTFTENVCIVGWRLLAGGGGLSVEWTSTHAIKCFHCTAHELHIKWSRIITVVMSKIEYLHWNRATIWHEKEQCWINCFHVRLISCHAILYPIAAVFASRPRASWKSSF